MPLILAKGLTLTRQFMLCYGFAQSDKSGSSSYRCAVKARSARLCLWRGVAQWGASCYLLLVWLAAPLAAREESRPITPDADAGVPASEEETELDFIDVLVTRLHGDAVHRGNSREGSG